MRNFLLIYEIIFLLCSLNLILGKPLQKIQEAESYENSGKSQRKLAETNRIILWFGLKSSYSNGVYSDVAGSYLPQSSIKKTMNKYLGDFCYIKPGKDMIFADLGQLNVQELTQMELFFFNCTALRAIGLAGLNFTKVVKSDNAFLGIKLTYLNLKSTILSDALKTTIQSHFNNQKNFIVCQDEEIVKNVIIEMNLLMN